MVYTFAITNGYERTIGYVTLVKCDKKAALAQYARETGRTDGRAAHVFEIDYSARFAGAF